MTASRVVSTQEGASAAVPGDVASPVIEGASPVIEMAHTTTGSWDRRSGSTVERLSLILQADILSDDSRVNGRSAGGFAPLNAEPDSSSDEQPPRPPSPPTRGEIVPLFAHFGALGWLNSIAVGTTFTYCYYLREAEASECTALTNFIQVAVACAARGVVSLVTTKRDCRARQPSSSSRGAGDSRSARSWTHRARGARPLSSQDGSAASRRAARSRGSRARARVTSACSRTALSSPSRSSARWSPTSRRTRLCSRHVANDIFACDAKNDALVLATCRPPSSTSGCFFYTAALLPPRVVVLFQLTAREPTEMRGSALSEAYGVRFVASTLGFLATGLLFNGEAEAGMRCVRMAPLRLK